MQSRQNCVSIFHTAAAVHRRSTITHYHFTAAVGLLHRLARRNNGLHSHLITTAHYNNVAAVSNAAITTAIKHLRLE